jgi:ribose/xylose/arabinose/galactoside ABC-type transport system permease subunit
VETVTQDRRSFSLHTSFKFSDLGPVLGFVLLVLIGIIFSPAFMTKGNILNILTQVSVLGLGAIGMTYVMIGGYIDLSVAGILSLNSVLVVGLMPHLGSVGSIIVVLLIGVMIGLINGGILHVIKGDFGTSIMITFGTGTIFSALAVMYTGGFTLALHADDFYQWFGVGKIIGIPAPAIFFFVCAVLLHFILRKTIYGRSVYLTGANPEAARLSGLPINRIRTINFVIVSFLVTLGAIIQTSQTDNASPVAGIGYELDVVAAVAIGGTSLTGGEGNIIRTIIGVLLIGVLSNLFILLSLDSFIQMIAKGFIILLALLIDKRKETNLAGVKG